MTIKDLKELIKELPDHTNIDISDNGIYMNIDTIKLIEWTDRNGCGHVSYTIIPAKYNDKDSIVTYPGIPMRE